MAKQDGKNLAPKIFKPAKSSPEIKDTSFVDNWIRIEFIFSGLMLFWGGFVLRTSGQYDLIIIGSVFLAIATIRLLYRFIQEEEQKKRTRQMDRILFRLREKLNPNYSIALSYPLNDKKRIDYLVIGPGGIFAISRFEAQGYIEGEPGDEYWLQSSDENSEKKNELNNPLISGREKINLLKKKLRDLPPSLASIKPKNRVACTYHRVKGPPLKLPEIQPMDELCDHITSYEQTRSLDWDTVKDLEKNLNFNSYH